MIRPSAEDINAIVDTTREWPSDARARLIERLKAADAGRTSGTIKVAGGPTAAEVIARFGQPARRHVVSQNDAYLGTPKRRHFVTPRFHFVSPNGVYSGTFE